LCQGWAFAHICSFALFERAKEQLLICSFQKSDKRAIALSLFCKERQKERSLIRFFLRAIERKIAQSLCWKWAMSDWANERMSCPVFVHIDNERSLFFEQKMFDLENRSFFAHFCSFALFDRAKERSLISKERQKSNCSFALFQRAIAHSLFFKEQLSERSHNHSFEKSGNEQRANERMSNCPTL